MMKNTVKYVVDVVMGISFLICFLTGLMKWPNKAFGHMIPPGSVSALHDYSGIVLGIIIVVHVLLNWSWITQITRKMLFKKLDQSSYIECR
jgi:hypothetical protein